MSDHKDRQEWMRDTFTDALLSEQGPQDYGGSPRRNQIVVGIALARIWADWRTGLEARPAVDTIASRLGMSANPVRAALNALTEQGWLIADVKPNRPTVYTMNIPDRASESTPLKVKTSESTLHNLKDRASESEQEGFRNEGRGLQNLRTIPNQEHKSRTEVEDAREDGGATNTPQQVVKDTKRPSRLERAKELLATNDTEDMARGIYLIAKSCSYKLNEGDCSTIAFSLQFAEFSVEEIIQYVVEKIGYHHDKTSNLLTSFITKDASVWLLESRERARAIGVYDGPTYRRMELPDEPEEVKEPEPELTEEQKQKIRDDFDRMMREGIDPFAVRMSQ